MSERHELKSLRSSKSSNMKYTDNLKEMIKLFEKSNKYAFESRKVSDYLND